MLVIFSCLLLFYSLQEDWNDLAALCNESLNLDEDLTSLENTNNAIELLNNLDLENHICKSEPMVLNCFLNNVVGLCCSE